MPQINCIDPKFKRREKLTDASTTTSKSTGKQDYVTPHDFIARVCARWKCEFDLAASRDNHRFPAFFDKDDDALFQNWGNLGLGQKFFWLNPPFKDCGKFMEKCVHEMKTNNCKIVTLTLANRATKWYREIVRPNALSLILVERITFEGQEHSYPKELMINIFDNGITGEGYWEWKKTKPYYG